MNVLLFNCRPLQMLASNDTPNPGLFSIFTVFYPDDLICFDAVFVTVGNNDIQEMHCAFIEETPKRLDLDLDDDMICNFEKMIESNSFKQATLPTEIANKIIHDAMDVSEQLITN